MSDYEEEIVAIGGLAFRYTNEAPPAGWVEGDTPGEHNDWACQVCGQPWGH